MDATRFELRVSLPADPRFAGTLRELAAHAGRYAGLDEGPAAAFGRVVEAVALACLEPAANGGPMPAIVRRGDGPIEVLIASPVVPAVATGDPNIRIERTREHGHDMCRVVRSMPIET